jgi:hypothetical protein
MGGGTMQLTNFLDSHAYPWLATAVAGVLAVITALIAHAVLFAALRRLARSIYRPIPA